jgi:hypothetical protein
MLRRLNQEEVLELINEKQIFQEQLLFDQYKNKKKFEEEISEDDNYENDIDDSDSENKTKKIYDEDSIYSNKDRKIFNYSQKRKRG